MKEEYSALRSELMAWQSRRFTILATSISLVTGILGLDGVLKGESILDWGLVTSVLWFFLGAGAAVTWYAGRANAKIAAYIIVFHEGDGAGWESRLKDLKEQRLDWFNLNRMVLLIYAGLGVLSYLVPWAVRGYGGVSGWVAIVLALCAAWFLFGLYLLFSPSSRDYYVEQWDKS